MPTHPPRYTPLWCKSNFSFLEAASHPDELVETAAFLGISSLALTDRDGVHGVVHAHRKALELGVHLIIGSEITVDDDSTIVLLATDRPGYANLCRLITRGRRRSEKGRSSVSWREVCEHAGGLIALWGGERSLLAGDVGGGCRCVSRRPRAGEIERSDSDRDCRERRREPDSRRNPMLSGIRK